MEKLFYKTLLTVILNVLVSLVRTDENNGDVCQGKPADVIFVLDSSGSIGYRDFQRQLEFVINVIDVFDVSSNMTRIGVISFSNWAFLDFHLNSYSTKSDIKSAVSRIRQIRGDTNTAAALQYVQDVSFSRQHGARRGIPHIAIVLTDGKSNKPHMTTKEATRARLGGGIHIFAIGVGKGVVRRELKAIASDPDDKYVIKVGDYESLSTIKDLLAIETCKVTDPPPTLPIPTAVAMEMVVDQACGDASLADIMVAVSPSATSTDTNTALNFYKDLITGLDLRGDNVRVGLVPKDCAPVPEIDVQNYEQEDTVMNQLNLLTQSQPSMTSVLRYMRRHAFTLENGGRRGAKRIGVLIVDNNDKGDIRRALREAAKARIIKGIELFVIGVGKDLEPNDLRDMATSPPEQHVFHVGDYDELQSIAFLVTQAICPVQSL